MNEKQALEVIKAALDLASSKGVFSNLDMSAAVIQAYNIVSVKFSIDNNTRKTENEPTN